MAERCNVAVQERVKPTPAADWREVTLNECVELNDSTYSPKEAWPVINYLDTGSIQENRISEIQVLETGRDKIPSRARRKVQPGDIVYSTVRPNQKHFGLLKNVSENFLVSTGFTVLRGKAGIADTGFLYWFLAQDQIVDYLHSIAENSTSAYPSIRPSDLGQLTLSLPPLTEQCAIARMLGTLDEKVELNRRMNETLQAMAHALFKSWFVNFDPVRAKMEGRWHRGESIAGLPGEHYDLFPDRLVDSELGEIPKGWEVGAVSQLAERIQNGGTPKRSEPIYWDAGDIPWLTSGEVRQPFVLDTQSCISRLGLEHSSAKMIPARSILVALYGATAGQVSMNIYPLTTNQAVSAIIPSDGNRYFCLVSLKSQVGDLGNRAVGSAQQNISKKAVESTNVVLPPIELRLDFDIMVKGLFERIYRNLEESRTLVAQRDALLPGLVSGQLKLESV